MKDFVDPYTKQVLLRDERGNLYRGSGKERVTYTNHDGCYDFTRPGSEAAGEREHYDKQYGTARRGGLTLDDVKSPWYDDTRPQNLALLQSLGEVAGKRILLLGNGTSLKELYFLKLGAEVVYTDLSIAAAKYMKRLYLASGIREQNAEHIEFHAVDALHLPFADSSFDIIYGFAFVHHLEDLHPFLAEVRRCLKDGGICRFMDGAYSSIWQTAKRTVLRPVQVCVHRRWGVSPEDMRATRRGGYSLGELQSLREELGFRDMVFIRMSFFLHISRRGLGKLINWNPKVFKCSRPLLLFTKWLDKVTCDTSLMRRNQLLLIWGFDK